MDIEFIHNECPQMNELLELFNDCQQNRLNELSISNIGNVLEYSSYYICAYQNHSLVGFVRLFTDWASRGFLCNLMVFKAHRGKGIGKSLMMEMLKICDERKIPVINFSDFRGHHFYQDCGFHHAEDFDYMYRIHPQKIKKP